MKCTYCKKTIPQKKIKADKVSYYNAKPFCSTKCFKNYREENNPNKRTSWWDKFLE